MQGPQGIRGETGPQGEGGAPGPAGSDGLAATIEIEDASRVPFDNSPYVKNIGTPHAAVLRFGIPAGMPGAPGETGPAGQDGDSAYKIALEKGYIGTETEWLESLKGEAGPTGPQGIQGETGSTGPQGIQGETGPTGPVAAMIPFSISKYGINLSVGADGEPLLIGFSGFSPGYSSDVYLQEGEWKTGFIRISEGTNYPTSFVMTFNGTLKKIYLVFSVNDNAQIPDGASILPFACLAVSTADELVYQILPETVVYADPYEGGMDYPMHTLRKGSRTDLSTAIPEGSLVAIVTGIMGTGITSELFMMLSVSGGLYLE